MLLTSKYQRATAPSSLFLDAVLPLPQPQWNEHPNIPSGWSEPPIELPQPAEGQPKTQIRLDEIDPLYLFSCHLAWEQQEDTSAAWELLAAAQSLNPDTRAHARAAGQFEAFYRAQSKLGLMPRRETETILFDGDRYGPLRTGDC